MALKRRYYPWFSVVVAVLFVVFVYVSGVPFEFIVYMSAGAVVVTFLNIKMTKFCDDCGKTIINQMTLMDSYYCGRCGVKYKE